MHACCSSESGGNAAQVAGRLLLRGAVLLDRRDVVRRQQVQRVHPGAREPAQVAHAVAARVREGEVRAAMRGRDRLVGDREVAHVQLVDGRVLGLAERRLGEPVPAPRGERARAQVDEHRAPGVRRQRQRVRVGHDVRHDLVERRHIDLHLVGVGGVAPAAAALRAPHAVLAAPHRDAALEPVEGDQQADLLGGRRPHREPRAPATPGRAEPGVGGVEVVEHAGICSPVARTSRPSAS